jgi:hypothetical protein
MLRANTAFSLSEVHTGLALLQVTGSTDRIKVKLSSEEIKKGCFWVAVRQQSSFSASVWAASAYGGSSADSR